MMSSQCARSVGLHSLMPLHHCTQCAIRAPTARLKRHGLAYQGVTGGSKCARRLPATDMHNGVVRRKVTASSSSGEGDNSKEDEVRANLPSFLGGTIAVVLGLAAAAMYIDKFTDVTCIVAHTCTPISPWWKGPLIATHLYTFLLVPASMYVFYDKLISLKAVGARSPFTAIAGLAYIMVSIMGEIGWHIQQDWFYVEQYTVQNLAFYVFLILGLSMWAFGIRVPSSKAESVIAQGSEPWAWDVADYLLAAAPFLSLALYLLGAEFIHSKVPIYIMMSGIFVILTYRFKQLLGTPKVYLFPLFSVGVNLFFIFLLNKYQTSPTLNPLFHICHDALGTELGIGIIAALTYITPVKELPANKLSPAAEEAIKWSSKSVKRLKPAPLSKNRDWFQLKSLVPPKGVPARGTILFLHGFEEQPEDYSNLLEPLAGKGWTVMAPVAPRGTDAANATVLQEVIFDDACQVGDTLETLPAGAERAIVGHSLGGMMTYRTAAALQQRHGPDFFAYMATMSPIASGVNDPKKFITNGFTAPKHNMVLTAGLDILAPRFAAESEVIGPLQAVIKAQGLPADALKTRTFWLGNHTGYAGAVTFFGGQFSPGVMAVLQPGGATASTLTVSWWDEFKAYLGTLWKNPRATEAGIIVLLGVISLVFLKLAADTPDGVVHNVESVVGYAAAAFVVLELFWVLYYAPEVQGPDSKELLSEFFADQTD